MPASEQEQEKQEAALIKACKNDEVKKVELALSKGASAECTNAHGV